MQKGGRGGQNSIQARKIGVYSCQWRLENRCGRPEIEFWSSSWLLDIRELVLWNIVNFLYFFYWPTKGINLRTTTNVSGRPVFASQSSSDDQIFSWIFLAWACKFAYVITGRSQMAMSSVTTFCPCPLSNLRRDYCDKQQFLKSSHISGASSMIWSYYTIIRSINIFSILS